MSRWFSAVLLALCVLIPGLLGAKSVHTAEAPLGDFLVNFSEASGSDALKTRAGIRESAPFGYECMPGDAYCHNDPINHVDVLGLATVSLIEQNPKLFLSWDEHKGNYALDAHWNVGKWGVPVGSFDVAVHDELVARGKESLAAFQQWNAMRQPSGPSLGEALQDNILNGGGNEGAQSIYLAFAQAASAEGNDCLAKQYYGKRLDLQAKLRRGQYIEAGMLPLLMNIPGPEDLAIAGFFAAGSRTLSVMGRTATRGVQRCIASAPPGSAGNLLPESALKGHLRRLHGMLPKQGTMVWMPKKSVSMNQLRTLGRVTGDEYSMYTLRGQRLIIRGYGREIIVPNSVSLGIRRGDFGRWSGHTHPPGYLTTPGPGDRKFWPPAQAQSAIWGDAGSPYLFGPDETMDEILNSIARSRHWRRFYER